MKDIFSEFNNITTFKGVNNTINVIVDNNNRDLISNILTQYGASKTRLEENVNQNNNRLFEIYIQKQLYTFYDISNKIKRTLLIAEATKKYLQICKSEQLVLGLYNEYKVEKKHDNTQPIYIIAINKNDVDAISKIFINSIKLDTAAKEKEDDPIVYVLRYRPSSLILADVLKQYKNKIISETTVADFYDSAKYFFGDDYNKGELFELMLNYAYNGGIIPQKNNSDFREESDGIINGIASQIKGHKATVCKITQL